MSKFTKFKNNPKMFFKDFFEKRFGYKPKKIIDFSNAIEKQSILDKEKIVTEVNKTSKKNSTPKKNNAEGYNLYLNQSDSVAINNKQIMFDSFWGRKIGCHPYALYRQFSKDPFFDDCIFIWVKEPDVYAPEDTLLDSRVVFVDYSSEAYATALLSSKVLISNSNFSPYFTPKPEQYVVSTWHGVPIKTLGYSANPEYNSVYNTQRNFNASDLIISSSDYYTEKVVDAYGAVLAKNKVLVTGSPRIDLLLNSDQTTIKQLLGVDRNREILLYAPTWRGAIGSVSSDLDIQLGIIKQLEEKYSHKYEIFVSLHHLTKKALGNLDKLKIREVPSTVEINEVLSICDVVISDYSSIFVDYLVLDKPVILYVPDLQEYEKDRGLYLDLKELPVNIAQSLHDLDQIIDGNLLRPSEFDSYSEMINQLLPCEDGKASLRVINVIKEALVKTFPVEVTASDSVKKKVLISVGGLKNNGITKSLDNLLNSIDYDLFEIYLLVNATIVDKSIDSRKNLEKFDKRCHIILTIAPQNFSRLEKASYQKLLKGSILSLDEEKIVYNSFERENRRLFGKNRFDIVIDYTGYSPYWSNLLASHPADKKIIWQHSDMYAEYENTAKKHRDLIGVFYSYKYYDLVVSVSRELSITNESKLCNFARKEKFKFLPNIINPNIIKGYANDLLSILSPETFLLTLEKDLTIFSCVARLSPEKGYIRLLQAFSEVAKKNANVALVIVGSGVLEKELKELSVKLDITNKIIFTGFLDNPYPIIAASDCLVLASDYEGQGLVFLEAMTLGTYCIGSDIPVIRNLIEGQGGAVADLNVDALADLMFKVHLQKEQLEVTFDSDKYVANGLEKLYRDILN